MKKSIILLLCWACVNTVFAQDIHFTQYTESVMNVSPALAGTSEGFLRAGINYRSQWAAFGKPFQTMGFNADIPILKKRKRSGSFLGAGVNVFHDKSGSSNLSQLHLAGDLAGILVLDQGYLSLGVEAAYAQRSIRTDGLIWDNQIATNTFNTAAGSGENESGLKNSAIDFSAGMAYVYRKRTRSTRNNDKKEVIISGAVYHLTRPDLGVAGNDRINMRYTGMVHTLFGLRGTRTRVSPRVLYNQQGPLREVMAGCMVYTVFQGSSSITGYKIETGFGLGLSYRVGDALIPELHYYNGNFFCGLSYDFNTSSLTKFSGSRGGLELTLRFTDMDGNLFGQGHKYRAHGL